MTAESDFPRRTTPSPIESPDDPILDACRAAVITAQEETRGGSSLVLWANQAPRLRVRAAAGFEDLERARSFSELMATDAENCLHPPRPRRLADPTGTLAHEGRDLLLIPLVCDRGATGVLVTMPLNDGNPSVARRLIELADHLALQIDHARLLEEVSRLRQREPGAREPEFLEDNLIQKVSRELRAPLDGIIEAIIAVMTNEHESLASCSRETLRSALGDSTVFLRTVQNLLDLWRLERSEFDLELHDVNFGELVDEAVFSLGDSLRSAEIAIEQHLEEPFPRIRADLPKVSQILLWLLDNAVKFTRRGRIEIHANVRNHRMRCEIRDTGIGICEIDQRLVFDAFYQVDAAASPGIGLGLTLARNLIERMGGTLHLESKLGHGTVVAFELPAPPTCLDPANPASGPN